MNDDEDDVCILASHEAPRCRFDSEPALLPLHETSGLPARLPSPAILSPDRSPQVAATSIQRWVRSVHARRSFRRVVCDLRDYLLIEERRERYVAPPFYASRAACDILVRFLQRVCIKQKALRAWGGRMRWLRERGRLVDLSFPVLCSADTWSRSRTLESWSVYSAPPCPTGTANPIQKWLAVTHKHRCSAARKLARVIRRIVQIFRGRQHRRRIFRELLFVGLDEADRRLVIESACHMTLCDLEHAAILGDEALSARWILFQEAALRQHISEQGAVRDDVHAGREAMLRLWRSHVSGAYEYLLHAARRHERGAREGEVLRRNMALVPILMSEALELSCLVKAELLSSSLQLIDDVASKGLVFLDRRTTPRIVDFFDSAHYGSLPPASRLCVDVDEWYIHLREEECLSWDRMLLKFSQNRLRQKLDKVGYLESMTEVERLQRSRLVSQMLRAAPIRYAQCASLTYSTKQYLPQQPALLTPIEQGEFGAGIPVGPSVKGPAPPSRARVISHRPRSASSRAPMSASAHVPYRLGLSAALAKAIDGARGSIRSRGGAQRPASARTAADETRHTPATVGLRLDTVDNEEEFVYI